MSFLDRTSTGKSFDYGSKDDLWTDDTLCLVPNRAAFKMHGRTFGGHNKLERSQFWHYILYVAVPALPYANTVSFAVCSSFPALMRIESAPA